MQPIKIISRHTDLREAVRAAGIDLSYNEAIGLQKIRDIQPQCPLAYVVEENGKKKVLYVYECDIDLLPQCPIAFWQYDMETAAKTMIEQRRADKGRITACIEQTEIGAA